MASIDRKGLVDDGGIDLSVAGSLTVGATLTVAGPITTTTIQNTTAAIAGTALTSIIAPGFYFVAASGTSGQGAFTGSCPPPSRFPGSMLCFTDTYGVFDWALTGSALSANKAVFVHQSGSLPGALPVAYGGTRVSLSPFGSIAMISDGFRWCILGGTGSMNLSGLNL